MSVMLDSVRELERQDFAAADAASFVSPQKVGSWAVIEQVIEFP